MQPSPYIPSRRWPRRVLLAANIVVAVCLIGAASAYGYVQWRLGQIHREKLSQLTGSAGGKPFTVLIVGSDTRSALANNADNQQFGGSSATPGQRSDTIILARIAPATRQIELLSIPRDLWVNIPGQGPNRINSAFDTGANLLIQTIETDLQIPVNHYVEVNFDTFRDITDAVGGVKFWFPTPAKDTYSNLNVPTAGCVTLTGDQALGFVRSRHYQYYENGYWHFEAESDLARIQRQQAFIKKMIKKAEGEFTNPVALNGVIAGLTKNLTLDSGFSTGLLISLAQDFHSINAAAIPNETLPNTPFTTAGGADVLSLQQPQASQMIAAFNNFGNPAPPVAPTAPTTTAAPPAPSAVRVEVANGTGQNGQAAALTSQLSTDGFQAVTNTADGSTGHTTTQVLYSPDSAAAGAEVAAHIPGGATIAASAALGPTPYNVEVITGTSYTANAPVGKVVAPPPAPAGPPPYVLPGSPPGFVPPASCQ